MIASILRAVWLSACILPLSYIALAPDHQRWTQVLMLPCLLLLGYATVMAIEFAWSTSRWLNPGQSQPTLRALLRAWSRECMAGLRAFAWELPWSANRWPDRVQPSLRSRRGLLLIHGYVCNRGLWNRWLARLTRRQIPFIALTLEPPYASIESNASAVAAAVQCLQEATGLPPVVVAHSMGGLVARHWWTQAQPEALHRLITIGTPHRGTWMARLAFTSNGREMRLGSSWWRALEARETAAHRARTTCIYSRCDNVVTPACSAVLQGSHELLVPDAGHIDLIDRAEVWALVEAYLSEPPAAL